MKHCCDEMRFHLKEGKLHFGYNPVYRDYFICHLKNTGADRQLIWNCPWCGVKLPKSLGEAHFDILCEMFEDYDGNKDPRTPEEFKTDEWWKKRGL